ncbi:hypothetical protein [Streptomyces sp. NPDC059080]|uniref:hypothetical protein n=1 Tax=Streptomyces sp. NPDC059080 TaxID=3346718 RepID=UPI0036B5BB5D
MNYLPPVDHSYWDNDEYDDVKTAATNFINAFRRMGITFVDSEIRWPRECCPPRIDYRINLGNISLDEAKEITELVNETLDQLERYRAAETPVPLRQGQ